MIDPQQQLFEFQKTTLFPNHKMPCDFPKWATQALRHHSLQQFKITPDEYRELIGKHPSEYSLLNMSLLLNIMEAKSPEHMGMGLLEYADFQEEVIKMAEVWRSLVIPERDRLKAEHEARERLNGAIDEHAEAAERGKVMSFPVGEA